MNINDLELRFMSWFAEAWGLRTLINWSQFNAPYDLKQTIPSQTIQRDARGQMQFDEEGNPILTGYEYTKTIVVPSLVQLTGTWDEFPPEESVIEYKYAFYSNLLTKRMQGTAEVNSHVQKLREILELQTLEFDEFLEGSVHTDVVEQRSGFVTETGDFWEVPVITNLTFIV